MEVEIPTSISAFNQALQKSMTWLKELKRLGPFENEEQAYSALRAVLHALRDRLLPDEAVHLGSELSMLIRGVYYEGFDIKRPERAGALENFLETIRTQMRNAALTLDPEVSARAVFALLQEKISAGEMSDVRNMLPSEIREFFLVQF